MNYRSIAELNRDIAGLVPRLPFDLDIIVGIPRSGLLPANLLSLYLNRPLTDVAGLIEGRLIEAGGRSGLGHDAGVPAKPGKILVVDDSLSSGAAMKKTRRRIAAASLPHKIFYCAAYIVPQRKREVDFFCDIVPQPRLFEWNYRNHYQLQNACVDIDGVLCRDPRETENDDGPRYRKFIETVPPLITPTVQIGWLVTNRLEKYRELTENWLARNGIEYRELVMMDYPDMAARRAAGTHGSFKAAVYQSTDALIFIESSLRQAVKIAEISGRDVLCTETGQLIRPGITGPDGQTTQPAIQHPPGKNILNRLLHRFSEHN